MKICVDCNEYRKLKAKAKAFDTINRLYKPKILDYIGLCAKPVIMLTDGIDELFDCIEEDEAKAVKAALRKDSEEEGKGD